VGGGLEWLDRLCRIRLGELSTGTVFILGGFILMGLLGLPMSVYQTFVIENRFGFNKTSPGLFVTDMIKKTLLLGILGAPLAIAALWLMQETGALWWVYVWLLWGGFTLLLVWAYPTLIAPIFNKFTPLKEGTVRERIQSLLKRTGFRSRGIFVMDGLPPQRPRQRLLHRLRQNQAHRVFDTLLEHRGRRSRQCWRTNRALQRRHVMKRML
jgi:STE24 endopeptidase